MANTILHKRSATPASVPVPGDLELGELALNTADGKIFMKKGDLSVVEVGGGGGADIGDVTFTSDAGSDTMTSTKDLLTISVAGNTALDVTETTDVGFDVPSLTATGNTATYAISSQNDVETHFFREDGMAVYIVDQDVSPGTVTEYLLSTAWNLSTKSGTANATKVMSSGDHSDIIDGVWFNPTGTKFIVSGQSAMSEYSMVTPYDIANATFVQTVAAIGYFPSALYFSQDGSHAYSVVRHASLSQWYVVQLAVGTPWDVSTISQVGAQVRLDLDFPTSNEFAVAINHDGTKLIATADNVTDTLVFEYTLSTPYQISAMVLSGDTVALSGSRFYRSPRWSPDGTKFYVKDNGWTVVEYNSSALNLGGTVSALYHDGNPRLQTKSDGVLVSGSVEISGANAQILTPRYLTASLPSSPVKGGLVWDEDLSLPKIYNGATWDEVFTGTPPEAAPFTEDASQNLYAGDFAANTIGAGAQDNFIAGRYAGYNMSSGDNNCIIGEEAFYNNGSGTGNIAIGQRSIFSGVWNSYNVAVGYFALNASTESYNTGIGAQAGSGITTGNYNSCLGNLAGNGITTGTHNVSIGYNTGDKLANGDNNICIGKAAGPTTETTSQLFIDITERNDPLIHGDMGTGRKVTINGDLEVTGNLTAPVPFQTQTGTTYTAVLGDADQMITMDNAAANTVTIPANVSVAYPVGTKLNFMQLGAGATTVAITTDTLNVEAGLTLVLKGQYAVATALKVTATTWVLFGNLTAA